MKVVVAEMGENGEGGICAAGRCGKRRIQEKGK